MDKKSFFEYLSSPYRIILITIFTILFIPHVFVVVHDINFVTAYEVDPGSIIQSILSLLQHAYNMNAAYHSRYYGWTYFSMNYFLLMPIYLAKVLKIVTDDYYLFVGIRFIFFMIGLASVLAYFEVVKRTLKHTLLSFTAALLYLASPITSKFFYWIHPETTGLLFLFISLICLTRFNEVQAEDYRWYTFGLLTIVLSVLSKHVFLFTAIPIIFLFIYFYCHHHKKSIFGFLVSKQFAKVLLATIAFSALIFFLINPFAFFQPKVFIANQIYLFSSQTQSSVTSTEAMGLWLNIIKTVPIIFISIILFPFTFLGAIILWRNQKTGMMLYVVNILSAILFVIIISITQRFLYTEFYFAPIYPFFVLNLISVPLYITRKWKAGFIKLLTILSLIYFLFFILVGDFSVSLPTGYDRLNYQNSATYKVYNYIEENIPNDSKIAHDHFVAIPSDKGIIACHFWQGCGTDYIEEFKPDYVIFDENWTCCGKNLSTDRLKKYISDHHFILIDTIVGNNIGVGNHSIGVWKKPDP